MKLPLKQLFLTMVFVGISISAVNLCIAEWNFFFSRSTPGFVDTAGCVIGLRLAFHDQSCSELSCEAVNASLSVGEQQSLLDDPWAISAMSRYDFWDNKYYAIEKLDEDNVLRFHFYSNGRDGVSASHGNDLDDINSWTAVPYEFYLSEIRADYQWRRGKIVLFLTAGIFVLILIRKIQRR